MKNFQDILASAKLTFDAALGTHELRFCTGVPEITDYLLDLARRGRVKIGDRTLELFDGEEGTWCALSGLDGSIGITLGHVECDATPDTVRVSIYGEMDPLDGTNWDPIDHDTCWMRFLPIVRDLFKMAGEAKRGCYIGLMREAA